MLGSPAGHGGPQRANLWPIAPATAASAANFTADGFGKYGIYSLFPGTTNFGNTIYSHSTIGRFSSGGLQSSPTAYHATHKDSIFSGYTFGAPTPPPGSPYSPVPVAQLELLTKGSNIIIHHPQAELPPSPKKPITVQTEPKQRCIDDKCCPMKQKQCVCSPSPKTKFADNASGCSRTNPVDWSTVQVKKEPGTPCQVAEISTSASPIVKIEVGSPNSHLKPSGDSTMPSIVTSNGTIPVGIAVARQRIQQHDIASSPSLPPQGLLTTVNTSTHQYKEMTRLTEIDTGMAANLPSAGGVTNTGTLLQCGDDRSSGLAAWSMGGAHGGALATPTVWQYPAPLPMEPLVPMSLPMPPVGFQLVRDPSTGGFLLLPTTEPLQQTVVWPSYPQPSSHVLVPQLPPPPLQLLSSATSDFMQTSTTLHQHTQTHSTRLLAVTTDSKRKIPLPIPATTLIKIETDATVDHTKTLQAVSTIANNTATVYTDQSIPSMLAAHVIYQHPTNLIVSQTPAPEASCRSQATSPVACLTPPPEITRDDETMVQDASNQTDTQIFSEDEPEDLKIRPIKEPEQRQYLKVEEIIQETSEIANTPESQAEITESPSEETISPSKLDNHSDFQDSGVVTSEIPETPEERPRIHEDRPRIHEDRPRIHEDRPRIHEDRPRIYEDRPRTPEERSRIPEEKSRIPEERSRVPEERSRIPEERPRTPEERPRVPELFRPQNFVTSTPEIKHSEETKLRMTENLREHPDLSGLELLSSIVEFENRRQNDEVVIKHEELPKNKEEVIEKEVEKENFGGLNLLCALAEQRILEEVSEQKRIQKAIEKSERKKEKRKLKNHSEEPKHKKSRYYFDENGQKIKIKHRDSKPIEARTEDKLKPCTCNDYRTYKSEEKAKKFVASKSQSLFEKGEFPCMNPNELNMRLKLADLQRKYKEKQQELVKLKSKKHSNHKECSKRHKSRKKSIHRDLTTPPPVLDKIDQIKPLRTNGELLKPPTLCAMTDRIERTPKIEALNENNKRCYTPNDLSDSTPEKTSSKKRKVGRPKKLLASSPSQTITETIVAKKPKKCYAIGYLLAAKQRLLENNTFSDTPPRFIEEPKEKIKSKKEDRKKHSKKSEKSKIRPKLKAEPMIKSYVEDDEDWGHDGEDMIDIDFKDDEDEAIEEEEEVVKVEEEEIRDQIDDRCVLKPADLEKGSVRVLTAMGGLFYAGELKAIEPPDVYSITLDGERGNRPHIMPREEILRDAILEVHPANEAELSPGTRVVAYWSQKYRCLYPGSVAEPDSPNPKFISVDFDDGDNGKIPLKDIRLLPPDYPFIEYDPNPLSSLSRRKRRTSTTDDRKNSTTSTVTEESIITDEPSFEEAKTESVHKDKKKLKKKKRDKLKRELENQEKKKKRKHKCVDENCQHKNKKHHKKHKKHKKHHHKEVLVEHLVQMVEKDEDKDDEKEEEIEDEIEEVVDIIEDEKEGSTDIPEDIAQVVDTNGDDNAWDGGEDICDDNPPEDDEVFDANPDDEVTIDDVEEALDEKQRIARNRQASCESRSKMTAFLPDSNLWSWLGEGRNYKYRGKKKVHYRSIQRGNEIISIGDAAVFLSTGSPDRPYIGIIERLWEACGNMRSRIRWFYHPEEATGYDIKFEIPGALLESNHEDQNDVQTICRKCEVVPLDQFKSRLNHDKDLYSKVYENQDLYYLAGYYDPSVKKLTINDGTPVEKYVDLTTEKRTDKKK